MLTHSLTPEIPSAARRASPRSTFRTALAETMQALVSKINAAQGTQWTLSTALDIVTPNMHSAYAADPAASPDTPKAALRAAGLFLVAEATAAPDLAVTALAAARRNRCTPQGVFLAYPCAWRRAWLPTDGLVCFPQPHPELGMAFWVQAFRHPDDSLAHELYLPADRPDEILYAAADKSAALVADVRTARAMIEAATPLPAPLQ